jgi:hypothetical protein
MCGYPGRCKDFFGSFEREIGCGHVSGLCSSDHLMPRAGMAMRRSGPNQWRGREALWECLVFLTSILPICFVLTFQRPPHTIEGACFGTRPG